MPTQKEIQSKVNLINAKLHQVKTSHHYNDEERAPIVKKLEIELTNLKEPQKL